MNDAAAFLWAEITIVMWDDEPETVSIYDSTPINAICRSGRVQGCPPNEQYQPIPLNPR
jgi:hypothetical protein